MYSTIFTFDLTCYSQLYAIQSEFISHEWLWPVKGKYGPNSINTSGDVHIKYKTNTSH